MKYYAEVAYPSGVTKTVSVSTEDDNLLTLYGRIEKKGVRVVGAITSQTLDKETKRLPEGLRDLMRLSREDMSRIVVSVVANPSCSGLSKYRSIPVGATPLYGVAQTCRWRIIPMWLHPTVSPIWTTAEFPILISERFQSVYDGVMSSARHQGNGARLFAVINPPKLWLDGSTSSIVEDPIHAFAGYDWCEFTVAEERSPPATQEDRVGDELYMQRTDAGQTPVRLVAPVVPMQRTIQQKAVIERLAARLLAKGMKPSVIETALNPPLPDAPVNHESNMTSEHPAPLAASLPAFTITPEHAAIFSAIMAGESILIEAVAGSGKTTTLIEAARRLVTNDPKRRVLILCFNKAISDHLKERVIGLPAIEVHTVHGLSYHAAMKARHLDRNAIRAGRIKDCAWPVIQKRAHDISPQILMEELQSMWTVAVNRMVDMSDRAAVHTMAVECGFDTASPVIAHGMLAELDKALRATETSQISFDELQRVCVEEIVAGSSHWDTVFIDEAQDITPLQRAVIARLCAPRQVVAVGDPFQAVYAWRGADPTAMDGLAHTFHITKRLPLSVTYRCSQTVVQLARVQCPIIRCRDSAPAGEVRRLPSTRRSEVIHGLRPNDLVVCRLNAPLIEALLERQRMNAAVPQRVIGEEYGRIVRGCIEQAQMSTGATNPNTLAESIEHDSDRESEELRGLGQAYAADRLVEISQIAVLLLRQSQTVAAACELVDELFVRQPVVDTITYSTIHRAKGLEAGHVVLLGVDLIPLDRVLATGNEMLINQENNLLYVAITRAAERLTLLEVGASTEQMAHVQ